MSAEDSSRVAFDIFISYSRRDGAFVDRLHRALERYAPPQGLGTHPGRLRVFRDTQDLRGSEYFSAIDAHLRSARKLVLVCSPDAAASTYVNDEVERFVGQRGAEHVIPVLWRGLPNNEARADASEQRAFPPALEQALAMPLAVDLRGFDATREKLDGDAHRSAWMLLLANVLDVSRADVEQRELKRKRARRRLWAGAIATSFAILLGLTLWALFEGERALARQLAAQASIRGGMEFDQVERRVLLARDAVLRHERLGETAINADTALRDAIAHTPRKRLSLPAAATARIVGFSYDGEHLLAAEGLSLRGISLVTGAEVFTAALDHPLLRLEASPDGQFVGALDQAGTVRLWSWPSMTPVREFPAEVAVAPLQCMTFTRGAVIATRGDGDEELRWQPGAQTLTDPAVISFMSEARPADHPCLRPKAPSTNTQPEQDRTRTMSLNGEWELILTPLEDPIVPLLKPTRIDIIDVRKAVVVRSLADHAGSAAFTPDAETVVSISGQRIRLWDRRDGRERLRLIARTQVQDLLFDRSSRQLAAVGADGSLEVFDISPADEIVRLPPAQSAMPIGDSAQALIVSGKRLLWPPKARGGLPVIFATDGFVQVLQASPNGRFIVAGIIPKEPMLKIGDAEGIELFLIEATDLGPAVRYRGSWGEYRFDIDSNVLLVAGRDGEVRLIDAASGKVRWQRHVDVMTPPPAAGLIGWHAPLAFSDDASMAVVAGSEGFVVLSGSNGQVVRTIPVTPVSAALSADGRFFARNAPNDRIEVRLTSDDSLVQSFDWREVGSLRDLMFSPGGQLLLAVGGTSFSTFMSGGHYAEEHVVIWSVADGQRVARVPESMQSLSEYQERIGARGDDAQQLTGIVWNRSTREFAGTLFPSLLAYYTVPSGMVQGTLVSWRFDDHGVSEVYRAAAAQSLRAVYFADEGAALLVNGEDGYRRIVNLRRDHAVRVSCETVTRSLTEAERTDAYGGGWQTPLSCPRGATPQAIPAPTQK